MGIANDLKKIRFKFKLLHDDLVKVSSKLGRKVGRFTHDEAEERELLRTLGREQAWSRRLAHRVSKLRETLRIAAEKLFSFSLGEGKLKRSFAGAQGDVLSKAHGLSRLSSKLKLWTYRKKKTDQELHEDGELVSKLSRRNQMSRKLKKLVTLRIKELRLSRMLRINLAKHIAELQTVQETKREKINIAHGRRLASKIRREHLTLSRT